MTYQPYARYNPNRTNRWQDWANLLLAIWFFFSPWILQYGSGVSAGQPGAPVEAVSAAAWNAWVLSVIVFIVALSAIGRMELWQEWVNLLLAVWIFVAPWALNFAAPLPAAAWDHWIVGVLIFIVSLAGISSTPSIERHVPSGHDSPVPGRH